MRFPVIVQSVRHRLGRYKVENDKLNTTSSCELVDLNSPTVAAQTINVPRARKTAIYKADSSLAVDSLQDTVGSGTLAVDFYYP